MCVCDFRREWARVDGKTTGNCLVLKAEIDALRERAVRRSEAIEKLSEFTILALFRIAARHEEIIRQRSPQAATGTPTGARLSAVPRGGQTIGSCS